MNTEVRIEIKDLDQAVGVELSSEELQAVTGGQKMVPSDTSGPRKLTDEWYVVG